MQSEINWDSRIIQKYSVTGPRYTSYPTANLFTEDFGEDQYLQETTSFLKSREPLSLYVHIPFCERACFYCGCNRIVTRDRSKIRHYLEGLFTEIQIIGKLHGHRVVRQLHWGGGTPSYLDAPEITELMHHLATSFELDGSDSRDFSIELDPRTIDEHGLALLKGLGFNRLSLGIQDFDTQVQKSINRIQSFAAIENLVSQIRSFEFPSINFDLIYGLPNQSVETMERCLDQVISLKPDRIACYNYAHMPDRFPAQRAIETSALPTGQQKLELFELIGRKLTSEGYKHIGLDHFSLEGDELYRASQQQKLIRNFQGYSLNLAQDLVGLGASAISEIGDCYSQNEGSVEDYLARLAEDHVPVRRGLRLTKADLIRKYIIQSICCKLIIVPTDIESRFDISFPKEFASQLESLKQFEADGLVTWQDGVLMVSNQGRLVLRNLCMLFDQYLSGDTKVKFSKVV